MGVQLHMTNGPVVEHKGALAGLLTKLNPHDILFIDEIHRLNPIVEETLYPAMEDYRIDVMTGEGAFASALQIPVHPFTLIGATTRTGLLTAPLYSRFGHTIRLDFYPVDELTRIVLRSANLLGVETDDDAAEAIAKRSRGTPRVANRLLRRVRDFAEVLGTGRHRRRAPSPSLASGSRSTRSGSIKWTDGCSRSSSTITRAARSVWRRSRPRSASRATRSRTCTSRTSCSKAFSAAPCADASRRRRPTIFWTDRSLESKEASRQRSLLE